MANKLSRLIPTAVGIVDKGANDLPFFMVKSVEGVVPTKTDKGDTDMTLIEKICKAAGVTPEQLKATVGALLASDKDTTVGDVAAKIAAPEVEPSPVIKAQEAEIVELKKRLGDVEDARTTDILVAKAKASYSHTPVKPDDYAKRIKALGGAESDAAKAYDAELTATEALLVKSALFSETGSSLSGSTGGSGAYGELIQKAAELRKAEPSLTEAQSIDRVQLANPEIAKRVRAEAA